jgi:hypothetical protein
VKGKNFSDWTSVLRRDLIVAMNAAAIPFTPPNNTSKIKVHLAVFVQPYLEWILVGTKTIESRFSMRRVAPYDAVCPGDLVVLKLSGGCVVGVCRAAKVQLFELNADTYDYIRTNYSVPLCAENAAFWRTRAKCRYATLIHLTDVHRVRQFACGKRDRRGWVAVPSPYEGD